jgi:hypothetical protein
MEPEIVKHDGPSICVIAQQYSFATFVSLHFHSRQEKLGAFFKSILCQFLFCKVSYLCNCQLQFSKPENVRIKFVDIFLFELNLKQLKGEAISLQAWTALRVTGG